MTHHQAGRCPLITHYSELMLNRVSHGAVLSRGLVVGVTDASCLVCPSSCFLVHSTGQIVNVPVGPGTLGRVTDALGLPIDGKGPLLNVRSSLVEVKAPGEAAE